jgi:sortase A
MRNSLLLSIREATAKRTRILRVVCNLLFAFGILALVYAGFLFADALVYQAVQIQKLEQASPPTQPRRLANGDVLGEISVPRLQLDAIVVQGDFPDDLKHAVGHLSNSSLPGEQGNVALAAHRDTFFRPLRDIRVGDGIEFKTRERNFDYVVESMEVVAPTDVSVLQSSSGHDLTLLTCYPFHYIGPAPKRFVVFAREVKPARNSQPKQYP